MTTPSAKSDASVSIKNCQVLSGEWRMGYELQRSFNVLKLACSSAPHLHWWSFFVRSFKGQATAEKLAIKLL